MPNGDIERNIKIDTKDVEMNYLNSINLFTLLARASVGTDKLRQNRYFKDTKELIFKQFVPQELLISLTYLVFSIDEANKYHDDKLFNCSAINNQLITHKNELETKIMATFLPDSIIYHIMALNHLINNN